jgi:hypothetical protein
MRSKQRPDTLMQDRSYRIDGNLLQRTAGPYIGANRRLSRMVAVEVRAVDQDAANLAVTQSR